MGIFFLELVIVLGMLIGVLTQVAPNLNSGQNLAVITKDVGSLTSYGTSIATQCSTHNNSCVSDAGVAITSGDLTAANSAGVITNVLDDPTGSPYKIYVGTGANGDCFAIASAKKYSGETIEKGVPVYASGAQVAPTPTGTYYIAYLSTDNAVEASTTPVSSVTCP